VLSDRCTRAAGFYLLRTRSWPGRGIPSFPGQGRERLGDRPGGACWRRCRRGRRPHREKLRNALLRKGTDRFEARRSRPCRSRSGFDAAQDRAISFLYICCARSWRTAGPGCPAGPARPVVNDDSANGRFDPLHDDQPTRRLRAAEKRRRLRQRLLRSSELQKDSISTAPRTRNLRRIPSHAKLALRSASRPQALLNSLAKQTMSVPGRHRGTSRARAVSLPNRTHFFFFGRAKRRGGYGRSRATGRGFSLGRYRHRHSWFRDPPSFGCVRKAKSAIGIGRSPPRAPTSWNSVSTLPPRRGVHEGFARRASMIDRNRRPAGSGRACSPANRAFLHRALGDRAVRLVRSHFAGATGILVAAVGTGWCCRSSSRHDAMVARSHRNHARRADHRARPLLDDAIIGRRDDWW